MTTNQIKYHVVFVQKDLVCELDAMYISEESLMGFVELDEIISAPHNNEASSVDPKKEEYMRKFKGVKRTYIPMHNILRIDEIDMSPGDKINPISKVKRSNVSHLPHTPSDD